MKSEEFLTPKGMSVARNATAQCSIFPRALLALHI
jgi:hypothetical protein